MKGEAKMNEELLAFVKEVQKNRRLTSLDEASTKQVVILKMLTLLGWNQFNIDEVTPEYSVSGKKVDYALRHDGSNKVFIEVKKAGEDLEKHQEQLLNYAFIEGVHLAILTNGSSWWFYLPLREGSWEQRKFYTIEIFDQDAADIALKFVDFLSKENAISGEYVRNAEKVYRSKQKHHLIKETLPKAWDRIIKEPDELLVELLAETVEKLCGYKPDNGTIERFLEPIAEKEINYSSTRTPLISKPTPGSPHKTELYTGKSMDYFEFRGKRYNANSWKNMLVQVCKIMFAIHRNRFNEVLNLRGKKRPYFTKNPNELRSPEKIEGTDIYVETNLSANSIVRRLFKTISLFGYSKEDISIFVK